MTMKRLLLGTALISFAMGATTLVIPLYASSLGANYTEIGMLGVAYVVLAIFFSLPLGRASDRHGRRKYAMIGFFTTALALALYSFAQSVAMIMIVRAFQGLTESLMWINVQGAVTDGSGSAERGKAMGMYGMSWGLGMGMGPVVGGALYASLGPFYTFLACSAIGFISAAIAMTATLPKTNPSLPETKASGVWPIMFAGLIYIGIVAIISTILPVYSTKGLGMSAFYAGLMLTLFTLLRALLFRPFGGLSDRVGYRPVILAGVTTCSLVMASFMLISGLPTLTVVLVLLAVSVSSIYPPVMGAISKAGSGGNLGYLLGIFNLISNIGWGIFTGLSGALADAFGPTTSFLISGGIGLAAAAILWKVLPKE